MFCHSIVKSGHISEDVMQQKADTVRYLFSNFLTTSQEVVSSTASFIHHHYITEVENLTLENINLSEVAHASSLADVHVTNEVIIINVTGNIAPIISRVKCERIWISQMRLSTEDTAALVQGMQTSVEEVSLGYYGPVELDMDTLLRTYNGRGQFRRVFCCGETLRKYGDQLAAWGHRHRIGWSMERNDCYIKIERKKIRKL